MSISEYQEEARTKIERGEIKQARKEAKLDRDEAKLYRKEAQLSREEARQREISRDKWTRAGVIISLVFSIASLLISLLN